MKKILLLSILTSSACMIASQNMPILVTTIDPINKSIDIALHEQIKLGDIQAMKKLIEEGADVNSNLLSDFPKCGRQALVEAIDSKSFETVELLLKNGAKVEMPSDVPLKFNKLEPKLRAFNSLGYAIMVEASIEIIELLIKYSKNINEKNGSWMPHGGWTAYEIAVAYERSDVIAKLLKAGAKTA